MTLKTTKQLFSIGLVLLSAACLNLKKPPLKIDYYSLEYTPPRMGGMHPVADVIKVEQFGVAPVYNTRKIIFRHKPYQRSAYAYHQWRVNPGHAITFLLARDLMQSGLFQAVIAGTSRLPAAFALEGSVDQFLEYVTPGGCEAHLSLSVALAAQKKSGWNEKLLFQQTYQTVQPCESRTPESLAQAMSLAMAALSREIITDVHQTLTNPR